MDASKVSPTLSAAPLLCYHLGVGHVQKEGLERESFCLGAESKHPQNDGIS